MEHPSRTWGGGGGDGIPLWTCTAENRWNKVRKLCGGGCLPSLTVYCSFDVNQIIEDVHHKYFTMLSSLICTASDWTFCIQIFENSFYNLRNTIIFCILKSELSFKCNINLISLIDYHQFHLDANLVPRHFV